MTILDGAKGGSTEETSIEADVIVTSTVLGLFASEVLRGHDVLIGYGEEKDRGDHEKMKAKLDRALRGYGVGNRIKIELTPEYRAWKGGGGASVRAITASGGVGGQRHIEMSTKAMQFARELQANTQGGEDGNGGVQGERGAYYGIVDHPTEVRMISTTRRLIKYGGDEGKRWSRDIDAHGMIEMQMKLFEKGEPAWSYGSIGALDTAFEQSLSKGLFPKNGDGVVGYCHGMNWAIMHTALLGGGTAYEVAVGFETSKLASCFGCTTFMYANGAPPSYMHFGRAESWVPIPCNAKDNPDYTGDKTGTIDALHMNWAGAVAGYLENGASLLKACGSSDAYKKAAAALAGALDKRPKSVEKANLFLDALTIHDSDLKRVNRSIGD
jgi:hypothetical protein